MDTEKVEKIVALRKEGYHLRRIGSQVGLSGERVRQILKQAGFETERLGDKEVAYKVGYPTRIVRRLKKQGLIKPSLPNRGYSPEQIPEIKKIMTEYFKCKHCGKRRPTKNRAYCDECSEEQKRYKYPFFSQERKRKAAEAVARWRLANPERVAAIQNRATIRYLEKKRKENLNHFRIVIRGSDPPIGTIFKPIAIENRYFVLSDGRKVRCTNAQKLKNSEGETKNEREVQS
ncbi:MAG: hypothetical protein M0P29_13180 [Sphaerochaetaceae bacterium]|nr:hypothetical protein [Sphaerochaetaceae bacterium]